MCLPTARTRFRLDESGGGPPGELARVQAHAGIRGWVTRNAAGLRHMTPRAILTGMTAAAFAPILVPLVTTAADPAAVQALLAQFGGAGAGYLAAIVQQFAGRPGDRPETPTITEDRLRELLRAVFEEGLSGASLAQTQAVINDLVLDVNGVDTLLQAAAESDDAGLLSHLVHALSQQRSFQAVVLSQLDSLRGVFTGLQSSQRDTYELHSRELLEIRLLRRELTRRLPAVEDGEAVLAADSSPVDGPCPYPGLAPFEERDAGWFFGRNALVVELLNALDERIYGSTPLMVAGVSGAGKSSVLRAGLIPDLRAGGLAEPGSADWPVRAMRPDSRPLEQLSVQLGDLAGLIGSDVYDQLMTDPARAAMIVARDCCPRRSGTAAESCRPGLTRPVASAAGRTPDSAGCSSSSISSRGASPGGPKTDKAIGL